MGCCRDTGREMARDVVVALLREGHRDLAEQYVQEIKAEGWGSLPKGWTQESAKKFWSSLTGDRKHKVTACIKKMRGRVDDPGAFCASLGRRVGYEA